MIEEIEIKNELTGTEIDDFNFIMRNTSDGENIYFSNEEEADTYRQNNLNMFI